MATWYRAALLPVIVFVGCGDDAATPGGTTGTGAGSSTAQCVDVGDCDDANPCTIDACESGTCESTSHPEIAVPGEPDPTGDCLTPLCIDGQAAVVPDDADAPEDPSPGGCSAPACMNGEVVEGASAVGARCTGRSGAPGFCDEAGSCTCANPVPTAPHFVDPVLGTDDEAHGGGPGDCAFATLSYALTHAEGEIVLAPAIYSSATEVSWPVILDDGQWIRCEEVGGATAVLQGSAPLSTYAVVVALTGEGSGIVGCEIDGGNLNGAYCIDATGATSVSPPLIVTGNDVHGCVNGIRATGAPVQVDGNTFHDHANAGFFAQGPSDSVLLANTFAGNGVDIRCNEPSPGISGSGNVGEAGLATCEDCQNCPFQ